MPFANRAEAGRRLADQLQHLRGEDLVVLGLPRGGVPVAAEVARALGAPLDVIIVRKLGVPFQPELAMGAVGEEGVRVVNQGVVREIGISDADLAAVEAGQRLEVEARARRLRGDRAPLPLAGRTAVIVDDGIATGATVHAACRVARARGAARVVVGAPVAPARTLSRLLDADEVVIVEAPESFFAIGEFYDDFGQVSDDEVAALLRRGSEPATSTSAGDAPAPGRYPVDEELCIEVFGAELHGRLTVPAAARGVVVFAHGSGSSRHSPRNRYVAAVLQAAGIGTLLFDLLTSGEEANRANVFDIPLLAQRLVEVTAWLRGHPAAAEKRIGYFGASTGAAAALWAAAEPDAGVDAVVSRGGRPDLAMSRLAGVRAPTLLIVGQDDEEVLSLNRAAQRRLRCRNRLAVVPGATHLFEEPGTLEEAAHLACDWFTENLRPVQHSAA